MIDQEQHEAILQLLKEQTEYFRANPAAARAYFIKAGVLTEDGELAPEYRVDGPGEVEPEPQQSR
ncbi:MAG: hypothetical protein FWD68_10435 [Alphaproteobacteria bacterium]|nr:hypothetical protein [Alphaproteobacteria bacterium]